MSQIAETRVALDMAQASGYKPVLVAFVGVDTQGRAQRFLPVAGAHEVCLAVRENPLSVNWSLLAKGVYVALRAEGMTDAALQALRGRIRSAGGQLLPHYRVGGKPDGIERATAQGSNHPWRTNYWWEKRDYAGY